MRVHERRAIRVALAVVAVGAVAGGARAAQADLTAAALLLLVTVLAVGTLGFPSGLAAALVGFLALNWFFTEPTGSFKIHHTDDVVALGRLRGFGRARRLDRATAVDAARHRAPARGRGQGAPRPHEPAARPGADVDDALHSAADALADTVRVRGVHAHRGRALPARTNSTRANVRVDGPGVTLLARGAAAARRRPTASCSKHSSPGSRPASTAAAQERCATRGSSPRSGASAPGSCRRSATTCARR